MHLFSNLHYGEGATTSFTEKCSSQGYSGYAKEFESLQALQCVGTTAFSAVRDKIWARAN